MEAPVLVLHQTPTKRTHVAIAHLSHLIVNTAAGCHFRRDALSLNAVILTRFCTMFQLRKSECSESFESEKFTMTVAWVPNHCEMFSECGCASKCEWASVNGRWIGLVGQRCENLVGCLKFHLYVQFLKSYFLNCCATLNSDILFSGMKEATWRKKTTSWAGSENLWGNEAWNALAHAAMIWQFLLLISYAAGPNFQFRYDERGVHTGVRWCLGWRSVFWSL